MNFDGRRQNRLAEGYRALIIGQSFEVKFGGFADIGQGLLNGSALGLAALQFRAPGVAPLLVLFDHDTDLARHCFILSRGNRRSVPFENRSSLPEVAQLALDQRCEWLSTFMIRRVPDH